MPNPAAIHAHLTRAAQLREALKKADSMLDRRHYVDLEGGGRKLMSRGEIAVALDSELEKAVDARNSSSSMTPMNR